MALRRRALTVSVTASTLLAVLAGPALAERPPVGNGHGLTLQTNTQVYALAVPNHDMQLGSLGSAPQSWSVSARAGRGSAVQRAASAPFSLTTTLGERRRVLEVADPSRTDAVDVRGAALDAVAGRQYTVTATMARGSGTPASLSLEFMDARGRRAGVARQSAAATASTGTQTVSATATAPTGTVSVHPLISSDRAGVGVSWWSTVFAYERVPDAPYDPRLGTGSVLFVGDNRVGRVQGMDQILYSGRKDGATASSGARPVLDAVTSSAHGPRHSATQGTVLRSGGRFRMWYGGKTASGYRSTRYVTSADGVHWGVSREVLNDVTPGGVVVNPHPSGVGDRYLMLGVKGTLNVRVAPSSTVSYRTYRSADGVTWKPLSTGPVLPFRDVATVSYDPARGVFMASTKQATGTTRQQFMSTSTDFIHWTTPRRALRADAGDPVGSQVYAGGAFRYGDQVLAAPTIYTPGVHDGVNGPMQPYLATSQDSLRFSRPTTRVPLVALGSPGALDAGMILPFSQPVVVGDTVRLYYSGWTAGHEDAIRSARIFMASWPLDRFASLRATGTGDVTTRTLQASGADLHVNFAPRAGGSLRAEVQDAVTGRALPGYRLSDSSVVATDTLATTVTWHGRDYRSAKAPTGHGVRLRLQVTRGDVYAFSIS